MIYFIETFVHVCIDHDVGVFSVGKKLIYSGIKKHDRFGDAGFANFIIFFKKGIFD